MTAVLASLIVLLVGTSLATVTYRLLLPAYYDGGKASFQLASVQLSNSYVLLHCDDANPLQCVRIRVSVCASV